MAGKRNRWGRLRGVERGVWEVRNKRSVNPESKYNGGVLRTRRNGIERGSGVVQG